jgi:hypothetical protein
MRGRHHISRRRVSWEARAQSKGDNFEDEKRRNEMEVQSEWRDGPEPSSTFASLFEALKTGEEGRGDDERDPMNETENFTDDENCDNCDDETSTASPFCSISFIDESVDDGEGEGGFVSPMEDRIAAVESSSAMSKQSEPSTAPVTAWPPWLADDVANTFDEFDVRSVNPPAYPSIPAVVESAFVEVCAGKACSKAGSGEIHQQITNAAPATWRCEQRKKCWGLCQAACVVRVTKGTKQETHVRVTPLNAVATVLEAENRDRWGIPQPSNFVYRREPEGEEVQEKEKELVDALGPSLPWKPPASVGFLAEAIDAVERGVVDPVEVGDADQSKVDRKKEWGNKRPGVTNAERASECAASVFQELSSYTFGDKNNRP